MTDQKPTEEDTAKADRWVKQHATGWNGYVVDSLAVLLATIRAEAWKQGAKEAAELCTPKLDHWDKEIAEAEARGAEKEAEACGKEGELWDSEVAEFGKPMDPDHDHHIVRDRLNDAFQAGEARGAREEREAVAKLINDLTRKESSDGWGRNRGHWESWNQALFALLVKVVGREGR